MVTSTVGTPRESRSSCALRLDTIGDEELAGMMASSGGQREILVTDAAFPAAPTPAAEVQQPARRQRRNRRP
jgi:hypothetical protein